MRLTVGTGRSGTGIGGSSSLAFDFARRSSLPEKERVRNGILFELGIFCRDDGLRRVAWCNNYGTVCKVLSSVELVGLGVSGRIPGAVTGQLSMCPVDGLLSHHRWSVRRETKGGGNQGVKAKMCSIC